MDSNFSLTKGAIYVIGAGVAIYSAFNIINDGFSNSRLSFFLLGILTGIIITEIAHQGVSLYYRVKRPKEMIIHHFSRNKIPKEDTNDLLSDVKSTYQFEIDLISHSLYNRKNLNWEKALEFQNKKFKVIEKKIKHSRELHFVSHANVSMIIHLGYLFSLRYTVNLYQHLRDPDNSFWGWRERKRVPQNWKVIVSDYDGIINSNPDQIALIISQSAKVDESEIYKLHPNIPVVHISVPNPDISDLQIHLQVTKIVHKVKEFLDEFNSCETIHIFAAIPSPLAFRIGQNISNTMHPKIQLYEFIAGEDPKYEASFQLN